MLSGYEVNKMKIMYNFRNEGKPRFNYQSNKIIDK